MDFLYTLSKLVIVFGIFNVWLLRFKKETPYRGASSKSLKDEFMAYGYQTWFFYMIGVLKLSFASLILLGFWFTHVFVQMGSLGMVFLMIGAVFSHIKVKDIPKKYMPASIMLALSLFVFLGSFL